MPDFTVEYQGNLRTKMTHLRSGSEVITDAPVDNNGQGKSFSPTDLVSSALASCVMTILGIKARDMGFETVEMFAEVSKTMGSNPRRIAKIEIALHVKIDGVSEKQQMVLERTTRACPVAKSLHPDTHEEITFIWK